MAIRAAFFICGIINNLVYAIFLSAAQRILESNSNIPVSVVLAANIVPSSLVSIFAPYFIHRIPYSGLGELTFLMMTSYYESSSVSAWSSGTGGSGLLGSFLFLAFTVWARLSLTITLCIVAALPPVMLVVYFFYLPSEGIYGGSEGVDGARAVGGLLPIQKEKYTPSSPAESELGESALRADKWPVREAATLRERVQLVKLLIVPYVLPLFVVYWAQYLTNSGITPTILFNLNKTPFQKMTDHYIYYQALYQAGVFISRSSVSILHIQRVWIPSSMQVLTMLLLLSQALFGWMPSVYLVFAVIFWEGLLGGSTYVNTYFNVSKDVPSTHREFSMGVCGVGGSMGITIAAFVGMALEMGLCKFQVSQGNMLCKQH
ncbi:CLN3 protein-domain-containing protein [Dimargaris cristalligena]|uniref:Protein BTN n=1 Tax=Dimargaris cristalligena TaxID=215637 RepID=A0A4Q0A005_9FUNG|nr:CLN3 protein-domain-containing protein [Dimargaris cristalligena]|eukprot:RKP38562.1 CLN3 protein-domain-containing protein [Dimargaris cristalligena]